MCGIIGVISKNKPVSTTVTSGLKTLQHRGQDAAGIVTLDDGVLNLYKKNGLVEDVFTKEQLESFGGSVGLGHVRYKTAGTSDENEAQPFIINMPVNIAMVHNGNLSNCEEIRAKLPQRYIENLKTKSDSELLLHYFAYAVQCIGKGEVSQQVVFSAIHEVHKLCKGAYAVMLLIEGIGFVAFQDCYAIRPIVYGIGSEEESYMFASESIALDECNFVVRDTLQGGEAVLVSEDGVFKKHKVSVGNTSPCMFEFIYFASPDSTVHGVNIRNARYTMGQALAYKISYEWPDVEIDVVVPIPETSIPSALALAKKLDKPYNMALKKNKKMGRTFIMEGQANREYLVGKKFSIDIEAVEGKKVLVVDDSIVRGTTSRKVMDMLRKAGATEVYFASIAPEIAYRNIYGIDLPTHSELVVNSYKGSALAEHLNADGVIFSDLEDVETAIKQYNPKLEFEVSMFTGQYKDFGLLHPNIMFNRCFNISSLSRFRSEMWCKEHNVSYEEPGNALALALT